MLNCPSTGPWGFALGQAALPDTLPVISLWGGISILHANRASFQSGQTCPKPTWRLPWLRVRHRFPSTYLLGPYYVLGAGVPRIVGSCHPEQLWEFRQQLLEAGQSSHYLSWCTSCWKVIPMVST